MFTNTTVLYTSSLVLSRIHLYTCTHQGTRTRVVHLCCTHTTRLLRRAVYLCCDVHKNRLAGAPTLQGTAALDLFEFVVKSGQLIHCRIWLHRLRHRFEPPSKFVQVSLQQPGDGA